MRNYQTLTSNWKALKDVERALKKYCIGQKIIATTSTENPGLFDIRIKISEVAKMLLNIELDHIESVWLYYWH